MGIFDGCLLASDYDGTLTNSEGKVPNEVIEKIKYFNANGGKFTICTGRTMKGFHSYSPEFINAPVLVANGSMAYDYGKGETFFVTGIGSENASVINTIRDGFSGIGIEAYGADFGCYVINPDQRNIDHFGFLKMEYKVVDELPLSAYPLVKIMVSVGNERCFEFQRFLDSIDMGGIKYIPAHGNFIEMVASDADKGKGLLKLAKSLGISENRAFAVGNGANDVDMLKAAAVGYVTANGEPEAMSCGATVVKTNDEFAVADAIEHIEALIKG